MERESGEMEGNGEQEDSPRSGSLLGRLDWVEFARWGKGGE